MKKNKFMETMMNTPRPTSMFSQEESIKKNIIVLDILKKWIPPLATGEREQLEQNIVQFGCKDPLIVWETTNKVLTPESSTPESVSYVLLDGHNRYEICTKYSLDFKITLVELRSMQHAQDFMIDHQLGRRNLSAEQMAYLRGMKYLSLKQNRGKYDRAESDTNHSGHNDHYEKSASNKTTKDHSGHNDHYEKKEKLSEQLAAEFNVGEKTIRRDADFAKGVELLPKDIKKEVLQGKSPLNKKAITILGRTQDSNEVVDKITELLSPKTTTKETVKAEELKNKAKEKVIATVKAYLSEPEECDELLKIIRQRRKELLKEKDWL
jgi:hypothetical protein